MNQIIKISFLLSLFALALILDGCKKKEVIPPTKTELLTNKHWVANEVKDNGVIQPGSGYTPSFKCFYEIDANNVKKYSIDFIPYPGGSPTNRQGLWRFNTDETYLVHDTGGPPATSVQVVELTISILKVKYIDSFGHTIEISYFKS